MEFVNFLGQNDEVEKKGKKERKDDHIQHSFWLGSLTLPYGLVSKF